MEQVIVLKSAAWECHRKRCCLSKLSGGFMFMVEPKNVYNPFEINEAEYSMCKMTALVEQTCSHVFKLQL